MDLEDERRMLLETVNGRGWNLYDGTDYRNLFIRLRKNIPDITLAALDSLHLSSSSHRRIENLEKAMIKKGPVGELESEIVYFLRPSIKEPYDHKKVCRAEEIVMSHFGRLPSVLIERKKRTVTHFMALYDGVTLLGGENLSLNYKGAIAAMRTLPDISKWSYGDD